MNYSILVCASVCIQEQAASMGDHPPENHTSNPMYRRSSDLVYSNLDLGISHNNWPLLFTVKFYFVPLHCLLSLNSLNFLLITLPNKHPYLITLYLAHMSVCLLICCICGECFYFFLPEHLHSSYLTRPMFSAWKETVCK